MIKNFDPIEIRPAENGIYVIRIHKESMANRKQQDVFVFKDMADFHDWFETYSQEIEE